MGAGAVPVIAVDQSGLDRRVAAARRNVGPSQQMVIRSILTRAMAVFDSVAPRDTNRYVNGWAMAVRAAGGQARTMPLKVSKFRTIALDRLNTQSRTLSEYLKTTRKSLDRWERIYQIRYAGRGRRDKSARWVKRKIEDLRRSEKKIMDLLDRVKTERDLLIAQPYSVVFFGRRRKDGTMTSAAARAGARVMGGSARWVTVSSRQGGAGRVAAVLKNREEHASIVAARTRTDLDVVVRAITRGSAAGTARGRMVRMVFPG
jgi:hypothetical protein